MKASQPTLRLALDRELTALCDDLLRWGNRIDTAIANATYLLWVSHNLERIGDRCVNLSERTLRR